MNVIALCLRRHLEWQRPVTQRIALGHALGTIAIGGQSLPQPCVGQHRIDRDLRGRERRAMLALVANVATRRRDGVPRNSDTIPCALDAVPASSDTIPCALDAVPTSSDATPNASDGLPTNADGVPTNADGVPSSVSVSPAQCRVFPLRYIVFPLPCGWVMAIFRGV